MLAYIDERNADLAERYDEIDSLLESTLDVDDFVDLESLRVQVVHPDFGFPKLRTPTPPPESMVEPPKPEYLEPDRISGLIGVKKKRAAAEAAARAVHEAAMQRNVGAQANRGTPGWHHDAVSARRQHRRPFVDQNDESENGALRAKIDRIENIIKAPRMRNQEGSPRFDVCDEKSAMRRAPHRSAVAVGQPPREALRLR